MPPMARLTVGGVRAYLPVARGLLLSYRCDNHPKNLRVEAMPTLVRRRQGNRLHIGHGSIIYRGLLLAFDGGQAAVSLGEQTFVNRDCKLVARRAITIGRRCEIGWEVSIMDSDFHQIVGARPATAPVSIGDHVWIGAKAMVCKGVHIGDGAVVAAGAVVVEDVAPGSLVGGVPAKVIRTGVTWRNVPAGE
jgi:acetyltransferase-like isoleucine patch superfamily enzyme